MGALVGVAAALGRLNAVLLAAGRWVGCFCMAAMVAAILVQVFWRYVLGNALPWPEEVARFLMLWATGVMAPTAYRQGGFVGIDMVVRLLPAALAAVLALGLLAVALAILWKAWGIGAAELCGFVARSPLDAFNVPDLGLRFDQQAVCKAPGLSMIPAFLGAWSVAEPAGWFKVPRWWMMLSFHICIGLLLLVTVELMLRALARLLGGADRLPRIEGVVAGGAE
jgi:TRAP-type C4-dicarboxylate transport system permease small subunit